MARKAERSYILNEEASTVLSITAVSSQFRNPSTAKKKKAEFSTNRALLAGVSAEELGLGIRFC